MSKKNNLRSQTIFTGNILIFNFFRFVYDAKTGGVQKIMKPVELNPDLEIPKVCGNEHVLGCTYGQIIINQQ